MNTIRRTPTTKRFRSMCFLCAYHSIVMPIPWLPKYCHVVGKKKTFIYCALLIICDVDVTQRDYNTHANIIVIETSFTMRTTQQIYYLPSYVVQNPMNLIMCMHLGSIISTGGFVISNKQHKNWRKPKPNSLTFT